MFIIYLNVTDNEKLEAIGPFATQAEAESYLETQIIPELEKHGKRFINEIYTEWFNSDGQVIPMDTGDGEYLFAAWNIFQVTPQAEFKLELPELEDDEDE